MKNLILTLGYDSPTFFDLMASLNSMPVASGTAAPFAGSSTASLRYEHVAARVYVSDER